MIPIRIVVIEWEIIYNSYSNIDVSQNWCTYSKMGDHFSHEIFDMVFYGEANGENMVSPF